MTRLLALDSGACELWMSWARRLAGMLYPVATRLGSQGIHDLSTCAHHTNLSHDMESDDHLCVCSTWRVLLPCRSLAKHEDNERAARHSSCMRDQ